MGGMSYTPTTEPRFLRPSRMALAMRCAAFLLDESKAVAFSPAIVSRSVECYVDGMGRFDAYDPSCLVRVTYWGKIIPFDAVAFCRFDFQEDGHVLVTIDVRGVSQTSERLPAGMTSMLVAKVQLLADRTREIFAKQWNKTSSEQGTG